MEIPCKECIALAACRYKDHIQCKNLYDWIRYTNSADLKRYFKHRIHESFPGLFGFHRFAPGLSDYTVYFVYNDDRTQR